MSEQKNKLLEVKDLKVSFFTPAGEVKAVGGISYDLDYGEVMGVVGESGSGKSQEAYSIMGLLQSPGKVIGGSITFEGKDVLSFSKEEMTAFRGNKVAMIFQNPMTCLNPVYTIGNQITEVIRLHTDKDKKQAYARAKELLELVGINEPEKRLKQYPHEFSGGMRQRVMIAIAMTLNPDLLIADEPTTALDVTVQAQVVKEILKLRQKLNTSIILVTHNIGVASYMSDNIGVMYGGRIIEYGESEELINNPKHPYTKMLINSVPVINGNIPNGIEGSLPNFQDIKEGCVFLDRCKYASRECKIKVPSAKYWGKSHWSSCLIENEEIAL